MTKSKSAGFSLIELMIVVAIIAILAAIAIPNFLKFAMKSKTSEATTNLGAIRTAEEAYRSENDVYQACAAAPAAGGVSATPVAWASNAGYDAIGWAPDGKVRYQYFVDTAAAAPPLPPYFMASAQGDLDEDAAFCVYAIHKGDPDYPQIKKNPAAGAAGALPDYDPVGTDDF